MLYERGCIQTAGIVGVWVVANASVWNIAALAHLLCLYSPPTQLRHNVVMPVSPGEEEVQLKQEQHSLADDQIATNAALYCTNKNAQQSRG